MEILIGKDAKAEDSVGYQIILRGMTSSEFDSMRILLRELVEDGKRFSGVTNSQLDLKHVVSMLTYLRG